VRHSGARGGHRREAAVVVGAGQAGLSSSYFLQRFGVDHVVLDADAGPGGAG
jgi:protoporphyrinogen oxidase